MQRQVDYRGFYEIPQKLIAELDLYRLEVERFQRGEISEEAFKAFRVPWGIYSQRGGKAYMVRIRVPAGGLTPIQMEAVADLSERYGNGIPHVTDRQDVQIHGVRIEDTSIVLEALSRVSLSSRGGGGNTFRNATACARAGICLQEAFDVTPYSVALSERFMADPRSGILPRKFKTAFSGCPRDCALATVNDLGFIARSQEVEGRIKQGFAVYVGGGLGAHSRVADCLESFVPKEEVFNVAEAVLRLFDRLGERKNRTRARLRFVVERLGPEKFQRVYREEQRQVQAEKRPPLTLREPPGRPYSFFEGREATEEKASLQRVDDLGFQAWLRTAVHAQRQAGYCCTEVRLPLGILAAGQLRALAGIARRFGEGPVRTTHRQNILLRGLRGDELHPLYQNLQQIGLAAPGARGVSDVLSCPGAGTCNLGICLSRGLAAQITRTLEKDGLPLEELQEVDIRVSGCPNACGQHLVGAIGLHGVARRVDGRSAPHYRVLLGGQVEEGKTALGKAAGFVPARRVPELLYTFLRHFLSARKTGERFGDFLERKGRRDMEEFTRQQAQMPSYQDHPEFYVDWGSGETFSLAGLGEGECSAGVRDLIESEIADAGRYLYRAHRSLQERAGDPASDLYQALSLAGRALLVSRDVQPQGPAETFRLFREQFVETGLVESRYLDIAEAAEAIRRGELAGDEAFTYAEGLIARVRALYETLQ